MAVRYAINSGSWSSSSIWNGGTLPTSSDDVYANGFTVAIDQNVTVTSLRNSAQSPAVVGGGFTLNNGTTTTATNGFYNGSNVQLITFSLSSSQSSSIIGNLYGGLVGGTSATVGGVIAFNGSGTLNIIGNLYSGGQVSCEALKINNNGTINITGNIDDNNSPVLRVIIQINSTCTLNITGNIVNNTGAGGTTINNVLINSSANFIMYITGNVLSSISTCINSLGSSYMNIIGTIQSSRNTITNGSNIAIISSNSSAINIFSGPFICSSYGTFPYACVRMNLIPSVSNYIEFRDETTNGALPPGAIAPPTRMISPSAVADAPAASNVRFGVTYANGSQTGSCIIPNTASVAYGVAVDNTTGSALLSPSDVWNTLTSTLTVSGSIGERLKNVATVQTTAAQIAAF